MMKVIVSKVVWPRKCEFRLNSAIALLRSSRATTADGLCYRHKGLRVRNGHEEQHAIGLPRIRHYANKAAEFVTEGDINAMVTGIETVKRQADDFLMTHNDPQHRSTNAFGQPYTRRDKVEYAARRELANAIGNLRDVRLAMILATGLTVIQEIEPSLIKSDDAFLFQIARVVRRAGKPLQRGAKDPVPTRKGVMVEAGRRIYEAVGRVTLKLAREVRLQDEREHAQEMLQRDAEDEARAVETVTIDNGAAKRATILAGLDAWLAQRSRRPAQEMLMMTAQAAGLDLSEAQAWASRNGG
jgi:hypothetical protein